MTHLNHLKGITQVSLRYHPGITAQQVYFGSIYLRSMVAHFLQKDTACGNQAMLLFIGDQGCGKSRFVQSILPPALPSTTSTT